MRNHPWPLHISGIVAESARSLGTRRSGLCATAAKTSSVSSKVIEEGQTLCPNVKTFDTNGFRLSLAEG